MPGADGEEGAPTSTAKESGKRGTQPRKDPASLEDIANTDELEIKLDEVYNHKDHRLKGGREFKATS